VGAINGKMVRWKLNTDERLARRSKAVKFLHWLFQGTSGFPRIRLKRIKKSE
jgi:hypothetical protein